MNPLEVCSNEHYAILQFLNRMEQLQIQLAWGNQTRQDSGEREMTYRIARSFRALSRGMGDASVRDAAPAIRRGRDPLGEHFAESVSPAKRRNQGATFTPPWMIELQLDRLAAKCPKPARFIDAGAGTGRYAIAAARRWPGAEIIAIEKDPELAQAAEFTAAVAGVAVRVICADYTEVQLPGIKGVTAFIGNPPYVRHHGIDEKAKAWYAASMASLGLPGNRLAGLHIYFFLQSFFLGRPGDIGSFITSAEWFDNGYGTDMRALFDRMGGDHLIRVNPTEQIFADALTTSVISEWTVGSNLPVEFSDLIARQARPQFAADRQQLRATDKWPGFGRDLPRQAEGMMALGDFFKISRGQVTGCNDAFVATPEIAALIPTRYLRPCVTDAADIIGSGGVLRSADDLKRVVDLPGDLDQFAPAERKKIDQYLDRAKLLGAADSYTGRHRKPWWRVNLKPAPPIVMTYMGRRPPVFARNACGARLINIAHSLTPLRPMSIAQQNRWVEWLNSNVRIASGRTYGGGLTKFEPGEAEKIPVPAGGMV